MAAPCSHTFSASRQVGRGMRLVVGATAYGSPQVTAPRLRPLLAADKVPRPIVKRRSGIKGELLDKVCQDVTGLAQEFRANPYGRHSAELQRILNRMRNTPFADRLGLVPETCAATPR